MTATTRRRLEVAAVGLVMAAFGQVCFAQDATQTPAPTLTVGVETPVGAPVVVGDRELFRVVARLGPFTPSERAQAIAKRITDLAKGVGAGKIEVIVNEVDGGSEIMAGTRVVMTVTDADAAASGTDRSELAALRSRSIADAIHGTHREYSVKSLLAGVLLTLAASVVLLFFLWVQRRVLVSVTRTLDSWRNSRIPSIKIQRLELLNSSRITDALIGVAGLIRTALVVIALYFYLPLVFSFFPWTRGFARILLAYITGPLSTGWHTFLGYIPDLFVVLVAGVLTYYVVRLVRFLFSEVEKGTVTVPGFERDWARPTFKIVRFLIIVFAVIVAFPYLPGSESPAFKGVSLFLGLLFSLGSTSAIANIVAGVILTYTKAFRVGDRVRIADTIGDVVEKTLLVTRVRTIKNVEITVPNAMVMSSHIVNFSTSARARGLILHTSITIGYDVPWRQVHELLIAAAAEVEGVLPEPPPFVLQTALDDFYVAYEVNAFTSYPERMAKTYSLLHSSIQDAFAAAGVEIMSPHFAAVRDGHEVAIPDTHLPPSYRAPSFRVALQQAEAGPDTGPVGETSAAAKTRRRQDGNTA